MVPRAALQGLPDKNQRHSAGLYRPAAAGLGPLGVRRDLLHIGKPTGRTRPALRRRPRRSVSFPLPLAYAVSTGKAFEGRGIGLPAALMASIHESMASLTSLTASTCVAPNAERPASRALWRCSPHRRRSRKPGWGSAKRQPLSSPYFSIIAINCRPDTPVCVRSGFGNSAPRAHPAGQTRYASPSRLKHKAQKLRHFRLSRVRS